MLPSRKVKNLDGGALRYCNDTCDDARSAALGWAYLAQRWSASFHARDVAIAAASVGFVLVKVAFLDSELVNITQFFVTHGFLSTFNRKLLQS